jgi:phosphoglycerate dehydrogenase-like enzyme
VQKILVAIDGFLDEHMVKIDQAIAGWGHCVRINQDTPAQVYAEQLRDATVVAGWPKPKWVLESNVEFFQLTSVGYDNYLNFGLESKPNLRICNLKGVLVIPVAEQVVAGMFCLARGLHHHVVDRLQKRWQRQGAYREIEGGTVCVIGMGGIGTEVARRCQALGMKVIGVTRHPEKVLKSIVTRVEPWENLSTAIGEADHVVLCFPATAQYKNMFDAQMLQRMKRGAFFHNVGRGSVVDEIALANTLSSGHLAGAALDVFHEEPLPQDHVFWSMDNVLITPHSAGRSTREFDRISDLFAENLKRFHAGEPLRNQIQLVA